MYKELVDSIESNLRRFVEVPELDEYETVIAHSVYDKFMRYHIGKSINMTLDSIIVVRVHINSSTYVFKGGWEVILARLKELWVNE